MGFLNDIAKIAGETARIKRTENQENDLAPETRQYIETLKQNAQSGDLNAMYELGGYYIKGKYVGYDPYLACYWWEVAANRGHINSQYNLGVLYHGDVSGMYYDENLAGYWLNTAASNGHKTAYEVLQQYYRYSRFQKRWIRK